MKPMQLSKLERLSLRNQFLILAGLYPSEADAYKRFVDILEEGYIHEYDNFFQSIFEEMSEEECKEVWNIFAMYDNIQQFHKKHSLEKNYRTTFMGFDGNNEEKYMSYARFIIDEDRYTFLDMVHDLNSHCPMLPRYRKMLEIWNARPERYEPLLQEEYDALLNV